MIACRKPVLLVLLALIAAFTNRTALSQSGTEAAGPEGITLTTKDGVQLRIAYFPSAARKGTDQAKQATPVILLHDYKSTKTALTSLATKLRALSAAKPAPIFFAPVLVDLRAHGESTKLLTPQGETVELDAAKLTREGLYAMASLDMEAVRNFLVLKNDEGELNLNKLCIVGSGMGANVATNWALQDWSAPPLAVGKQGQDVKGLVLISPRWSFNGLMIQDAMKFVPLKQNASWMLVYGVQDAKVKTDVNRIQKQIERFHPPDKTQPNRPTGLLVNEAASSLQGDMLMSKMGSTIEPQIVKFLSENVATIQYPWTNRSNKLP